MKKGLLVISIMLVLAVAVVGCATKGDLAKVQSEQMLTGAKAEQAAQDAQAAKAAADAATLKAEAASAQAENAIKMAEERARIAEEQARLAEERAKIATGRSVILGFWIWKLAPSVVWKRVVVPRVTHPLLASTNAQ